MARGLRVIAVNLSGGSRKQIAYDLLEVRRREPPDGGAKFLKRSVRREIQRAKRPRHSEAQRARGTVFRGRVDSF